MLLLFSYISSNVSRSLNTLFTVKRKVKWYRENVIILGKKMRPQNDGNGMQKERWSTENNATDSVAENGLISIEYKPPSYVRWTRKVIFLTICIYFFLYFQIVSL